MLVRETLPQIFIILTLWYTHSGCPDNLIVPIFKINSDESTTDIPGSSPTGRAVLGPGSPLPLMVPRRGRKVEDDIRPPPLGIEPVSDITVESRYKWANERQALS